MAALTGELPGLPTSNAPPSVVAAPVLLDRTRSMSAADELSGGVERILTSGLTHGRRPCAESNERIDICKEIVKRDASMLHALPQQPHRTDGTIGATASLDSICNNTLGCVFEAALCIIRSIGGWFEVALYIISLDGSIGATASLDIICNNTLGRVFEAARRISCSIGGLFEAAFHVISLLLVAACRLQARKTRGREQRELLKIDRSIEGGQCATGDHSEPPLQQLQAVRDGEPPMLTT